jgi:hypothetical protein
MSPVQIDEYIIKQSYKKWSIYDHMPMKKILKYSQVSAIYPPIVNRKDPIVNRKDPIVNRKDPIVNRKESQKNDFFFRLFIL